jgi:hypothetical protein
VLFDDRTELIAVLKPGKSGRKISWSLGAIFKNTIAEMQVLRAFLLF